MTDSAGGPTIEAQRTASGPPFGAAAALRRGLVYPSDDPDRWAQLVSRGRLLAVRQSADHWALGDLALDVEPIRARGGAPSGTLERLARFADAIDVDPKSLYLYRDVASRWPADARRLDLSWSAHQALAAQPDRLELIRSRDWTVRAARGLADERRRGGGAPAGPRDVPGDGEPAGVAGIAWAWQGIDRILRRELDDASLRRVRPPLMEFVLGGAE